MATTDFASVDYLRVAEARLEDAKVLLTQGRTTGALYIAHYAVECNLKQLLINRTAARRRAQIKKYFQGTTGHDIQELRRELIRRRGVRMSKVIGHHLVSFYTGFHHLRYSKDEESRHEARPRIDSAEAVVAWVRREL